MEEQNCGRIKKIICYCDRTKQEYKCIMQRVGISRKTGYKWLKRYENNESLNDRSHAPNTVPNKTSPYVEQQILKIRYDNPGWGVFQEQPRIHRQVFRI